MMREWGLGRPPPPVPASGMHGFRPENAPPRSPMALPGAIPTLGSLQRCDQGWVWAICQPREGISCGHRRPLALAPFVIRWGPDVSTNVLRGNLHCSKCGSRGAVIQHPGWKSFPVSDTQR